LIDVLPFYINKMNLQIITISLLLLTGCQMNNNSSSQDPHSPFYVGTYTTDESKGIYKYLLREDGQIEQISLAAVTENPSFLTKSVDNRFLLAVNENNIDNSGSVSSFAITGDSLKLISQSSSGGAHPCYISVNKSGFVLVANYTGGNVGLLKLNENGELSDLLDVQQHYGKGSAERQQAPHAHYSTFNPDQNGVISIDLGTNELWFSDLNAEKQILIPSDPYKLKMDSAAGPRHMVYHPNNKWIYVLNELNSSITILSKDKEDK
jgi:6-phosphogluconolactonase